MANTNAAERPVRIFFTTRGGGASQPPYQGLNLGDHVGDDPAAVARNRAHVAESIGLRVDRFVYMEQVHSPTVTVVDSTTPTPVELTDAIVTTERDLALVVLTADCVPVLLSDADHGIVAAVHAGRLGARNGIVEKTVKQMVSLGATPATMHAWIGPAASGRHYELPADMVADVEEHLPGSATKTVQNTPSVDLRAGIVRQLYRLGVVAIHTDPRCTIEDKDFFSYRRDGTTGRQASFIFLPSENEGNRQ
ncbi:peptidoglycan editing factor PgeF [uncultured Corynebacterium sp.]|uniref:peptidoglycan editing factor PgeF n=1 Tax=uncultured Corynebacterium sp. TaxID=159447 RepID=UPI002613FC98|nr:peptidoglycan editing factor PgeF [uncultured Corynebacterium sp.]